MLAAVLTGVLLDSLMMLVAGRDRHVVRGLSRLSTGRRSAALEGQHCE
jgi:hypothetical protein